MVANDSWNLHSSRALSSLLTSCSADITLARVKSLQVLLRLQRELLDVVCLRLKSIQWWYRGIIEMIKFMPTSQAIGSFAQ